MVPDFIVEVETNVLVVVKGIVVVHGREHFREEGDDSMGSVRVLQVVLLVVKHECDVDGDDGDGNVFGV